MSFDFEMKGDASKAITESHKLEAELGKVESLARKTGAALTEGFARASAPIRATKDAVENLTRTFAGLNAQFKAEHDMLEKIHGPQKRLETEFKALDALYMKGTIDVKTYITQLEKLGFTFEKVASQNVIAQQKAQTAHAMGTISLPGADKVKTPGMLAGLGQTQFGQFTLGQLAPMATVAGFVQAGKMAMEASDRWTGFENQLQKFATTDHSVGEVLANHVKLTKDLNSEMENVIPLYDGVEGASQRLHLTQKELVDTTRTLGRAMIMDGKSLEQGAHIMESLEFAMEDGQITAKQFKQVMKEFPDVADMWAASIGKTKKETLDMAEAGKLGRPEIEKFMHSFSTNMDKVNENWEKQSKTFKQRISEWGDAIQKPAIDLQDAMKKIKWAEMSQGERDAAEATEKLKNSFDRLDDTMADVERNIKKLEAALHESPADKFANGLEKVINAGFGIISQGRPLIDAAIDPWEYASTKPEEFAHRLELIQQRMDAYKSIVESLTTGPAQQWNLTISALNNLYAKGAINIAQYNAELLKLSSMRPPQDVSGRLPNFIGGRKFGGVQVAVGYDQDTGKATGPRSLEEMGVAGPDLTGDLEKFFEKQDKIAAKQKEINALTAQWHREMAEFNAGLGERAMRGLETGLGQVRDEIFNINELISTSVVNTFHSLEDAIIKAATTGEFSFGAMADQIEADLTRIAIRMLLLSALQGAGVAPSALAALGYGGAHAEGGSYTERRAGGTDSQLVLFRMSTGERADFTPRGQAPAGGGGSVRIQNVFDSRSLLAELNTPEGHKTIINVIRSNPAAFRGMLNR